MSTTALSPETPMLKAILSRNDYKMIAPNLDPQRPVQSLVQGIKTGKIQRTQRLNAMLDFVAAVNTISLDQTTVIDDPSVAANLLMPKLGWTDQEMFAVVIVDMKHRVMGVEVVSVGTVSECLAHPREIFRPVIVAGGARVIVAHSHPSGSLEASPADMQLTRALLKAANVLGLPLLDHLILGNGNFSSLREATTLWQEIPQEAK